MPFTAGRFRSDDQGHGGIAQRSIETNEDLLSRSDFAIQMPTGSPCGHFSLSLMNPQPYRPDRRREERDRDHLGEGLRGTLISVGFWGCLLVAVGIYGLVVLSPKVVRWAERRQQVERNQRQLVDLQHQVDYWQRLTDELETNAKFRDSFQSSSTDEAKNEPGTISVETSLRYQGPASPSDQHDITPRHAPLLSICERVSSSSWIRVAGLATSAGMLLLAFTSLVESRGPLRLPRLGRFRPNFRKRVRGFGQRYVADDSHSQSGQKIVTDV